MDNNLLFLKLVLLLLSFKLLSCAHLAMCSNSSAIVEELTDGTIRYESSAYLSKELPLCSGHNWDECEHNVARESVHLNDLHS